MARRVVRWVRCVAQSPHSAGSHPELASERRPLTQLPGEGVELPWEEIRTSWPPVASVTRPSCKKPVSDRSRTHLPLMASRDGFPWQNHN